jgi:hypothetical protein
VLVTVHEAKGQVVRVMVVGSQNSSENSKNQIK